MTGAVLALAAASVAVRCKGPVEYDGKGTLLFTDDVRLETDDLRLECETLTAELDEESSPARLKAEGAVRAAADRFEGSSAGAEYDLKTRVLDLSGPLSVRLKWKRKVKGEEEAEEKAATVSCSRRARLRLTERTGRLEGDCVVDLERAVLRADDVDFAYSDDEEAPILSAVASNARVEFDGGRGTAKHARFDAEKGTIELEGDPVLERQGIRLTAPGMRIHLDENRVVPVGGEFRMTAE